MTKKRTGILLVLLALVLAGVGWWQFGPHADRAPGDVASTSNADAEPSADATSSDAEETTDTAASGSAENTATSEVNAEPADASQTASAGDEATQSGDVEPTVEEAPPAQAESAEEVVPDEMPESTEDAPESTEPRFDIVRVEADGQMVVAGNAKPNETVEVLLDGEVIGEAQTDDSGAFVTVLFADLSDSAQQLQLRVTSPETSPTPEENGTEIAAVEPTGAQAQDNGSDVQSAQAPSEGTPDTQTPAPAASSDVSTGPALAAAPRNDNAGEDQGQTGQVDTGEPSTEAPPPTPSAESTSIGDVAPSAPTDIAGLSPQVAIGAETSEVTIAGNDPEVSITGASGAVSPELNQTAPLPDSVSGGVDTTGGQFALSAPVIILPSSSPDQAPALVQPQTEELAVLQPAGGEARTVVLDRINYGETGDVLLDGRGVPGRTVRIYGNAKLLGSTSIKENGAWFWSLPRNQAEDIALFRFDELGSAGEVTSRIETPFEYSALSPQVVKEREIVVQKGDALWLIAEQYYGAGVRYSVIYGANAELIRDPDLIYPGQVFSVPELVDAN
jgi:nucleoid-associated protein YgaU